MERCESFESLNDLTTKCETNQSFSDSKKFGSLDSLSSKRKKAIEISLF